MTDIAGMEQALEDQQARFYTAFDEHIRGTLPQWLELHGFRVLGRMLRDLPPIMDRGSLREAEVCLTWICSVVRHAGGEELPS